MTRKHWIFAGAAVFLLVAAMLFGVEGAKELFGLLSEFVTSTSGEVSQ